MKSITIHNLDEKLYSKIRNAAKKNHRSMNQEIKDKLEKYFLPESEFRENTSFEKYSGLWSDSDYAEFEKNTEDFEKIDEREWRQ